MLRRDLGTPWSVRPKKILTCVHKSLSSAHKLILYTGNLSAPDNNLCIVWAHKLKLFFAMALLGFCRNWKQFMTLDSSLIFIFLDLTELCNRWGYCKLKAWLWRLKIFFIFCITAMHLLLYLIFCWQRVNKTLTKHN